MAMYQYTIAYRSTATHGNVDAMSRLLLSESPQVTPLPSEMILLMEEFNTIPITAETIRVLRNSDSPCSRVRHFVQSGWPDSVQDLQLKPFTTRKMSCQCKMVAFFGEQVVILRAGCEDMLRELMKLNLERLG